MAFLKMEELQSEAKRLGVDISNMKFHEAQGIICKMKAEEGTSKVVATGKRAKESPPPANIPQRLKNQNDPKTKKAVLLHAQRKQATPDPLKQYRGKTVLLAPELEPSINPGKWDEPLQEEVVVEEISWMDRISMGQTGTFEGDDVSGTFRIKERTGRQTIAQSTLPKENAGIFFEPHDPIAVPKVKWQNRVGYLWKHHLYPNVRDLLIQSGYYDNYKEQFKDEPNVWYSVGLMCCDINLVKRVFRDIEDDVKRRKARY